MVTGGVRHDERTDSELVLAVRGQGPDAVNPDPEAFGVLFDRWYDRCWNVARNIMRSDDLAAEVAQDAMLAGWQRLGQLQNPDAFGGWLLRITRNRALTRLEREGRSRATGDEIVSHMRDQNISRSHDEPLGAQAPHSVESAMEIHDRQELVWAASAALGERDASLLDLHLRHGLTPAEIAEELGVEANAAHQQLFRLRNKLGDAIGSYLLWRNGRTLCRGLAAAVSGDVAFDRSVAKAVAKHQKTCDDCAERRAGLVSPTKLFASVPFLVVPFQFKVDAAAALAEAGVPIDPSAIAASGPPAGPPSGPTQGPTQGSTQGPTQGSTQGFGDPGTGGTSGVGNTAPGASTPTGDPSALIQPAFSPGGTAPTSEPSSLSHQAILGADAPPDLPGPSAALNDLGQGRPGFGDGLAWTATRSAWVKSLGGATVAMLLGILLIGVLPGVALSDLWPFGTDPSSIGSETLAGPTVDETSTTAADESASGALGDSTDSDSSPDDSTNLLNPSPTGSTVGSSTAISTSTTVSSTSSSTTETTVGSSSSTTETTASSTTETTATTATTTDTSRTTSTDRDTTSSSSTTETTGTTRPPPPPRIVRFTSRVADGNLQCNFRNDRVYEAIWATENTQSVELFLPNGGSVAGKESGVYPFCGQPGQTISLVANGPGGADKASTTLR